MDEIAEVSANPKRRRLSSKTTVPDDSGGTEEETQCSQPNKYSRITRSERVALVTAAAQGAKVGMTRDWTNQLQSRSLPANAKAPRVDVSACENSAVQKGVWAKIHPTHKKVALRPIVFCRKCGAWMTKACKLLKEPCKQKPTSKGAAHKKLRMIKGLHPNMELKFWPDGFSTAIPTIPINIE